MRGLSREDVAKSMSQVQTQRIWILQIFVVNFKYETYGKKILQNF